MTKPRNRQSLAARLMRRLIWIAGGVLIANIAFVAAYDAADREALLADVLSREIVLLDKAILNAPTVPPTIQNNVRSHFSEHPDAYGYLVVDAFGARVDGMNETLIPDALTESPVALGDWVARQASDDTIEAFASHVVTRPEGEYRVYFAILGDPADLIGYEIWDEFLGHVWLPLLPTVVLLLGGAVLILRRDLGPVADAATWARQTRPGRPADPFRRDDMPSEIADLTDAVHAAIERLNRELVSEKRRAAEAAHALRTPVAVLVARLDGLPKGPEADALRSDVKALSRTVTQFLLSSGADRMEIGEDARVALNSVAEEVVTTLTPFAVLNDSEIIFTPADPDCIVRGSAEGIALALTNLVENAVFHGGGGPIHVTVGPGPVIAVSDEGPGLPDVSHQALFEPFWRGVAAPKGGAGLGLAIVDRIQRAHGGHVEASNAPEGGAVFRLFYMQAP